MFRLPDYFITISKCEVENLLKRGINPDKVFLNYCGIELLPIKEEFSSYDKQRVAILGRIKFVHKNQLFLVELLKRYGKELISKYDFVIIGEGPDEEHLRSAICENSLENHLTVHPWIQDKNELYSKFDTLLIPSYFEGIPLVLYEALYFKKRVFATNLCGIREILSPEFLFSVNNYLECKELLVNSEKIYPSERIDKYHQTILEKFNVTQFGRRFVSIIEQIKDRNSE
jgi:glycosyltransferase involved in cell wall biosynthesis